MIYSCSHSGLSTPRAFHCVCPRPGRKPVSRRKKSAKKKKGRDSRTNHLFLTLLRGWQQVSLTHSHWLLLTAEVAVLYIGGDTAVCIMQGHFSGRPAWRSWHQQHFLSEPTLNVSGLCSWRHYAKICLYNGWNFSRHPNYSVSQCHVFIGIYSTLSWK